jgi:hypothetical protein
MKLDTVVAYTFRADVVCPGCIIQELDNAYRCISPAAADMSVEGVLDQAAAYLADLVPDRHDESSFDSGDFPKVIFSDMIEVAERCGVCHELI